MTIPKKLVKKKGKGLITAAYEAGRKDAISCVNCDGKGYFSKLRGKVTASADFFGDMNTVIDGAREVMVFCDCERGKKLRHFFQIQYYRGRQDGANLIARELGMPKKKMVLILNDEKEKYDDEQY
jgi:hypothetical protein